ncbi:cytochrome d ubiquinol oxidase subunit II [Halalkalicoccus jeotgali]|uniref:Cytochrome d ubiquinol oxidase, subunit II n=1 Tax=Halalkalicoccus jeotgali (strain DSM 18796 / CECT 7217 / JCM 14584 / KCTC 4019 / B3) TaxID=795797 RepID=D8JCJ2_HALJB|nr:cytochrome d ubiquinol oxidase subunit II [Halalkalicoccus jeotgali]ADJ17099.1 cytochrome d ubiquinol oxidase, subunit II [Halalkalicoccus jeotgali B3]ELY41745.1 cytochrome d ubiquinol oxidase, subunit II [Halalkalicoccus jeotgali B3]
MTDVGTLASDTLFGLPLADIWFGLVFFILGMFLFLDGFDFGVGILFATRDDKHEREQLLAAITPFWDGNEVWLVVFGGALFAAFPAVYANLFSRHYLLMFAILGALILRGLAPEMYEQREDEPWQRWWGRAFIVGSFAAPFLLGIFLANWLLGATTLMTLPGIIVGLTVVTLTVVDGVAFLRLKTRNELRDEFKTDGYRALALYLILVVLTLSAVYLTAPELRSALLSLLVVGLVVVNLVLTGIYAVATRSDRYYVAFIAGAGLVFTLVSIIAGLMYPAIDRVEGLTVGTAIVSPLPLNIMSIGAALLLPLIFLYFGVLYSVFSGPIEADESY